MARPSGDAGAGGGRPIRGRSRGSRPTRRGGREAVDASARPRAREGVVPGGGEHPPPTFMRRTSMRSFLDLFRTGRDRRPKVKAKATRLVPTAEGLEPRNLMARVGGILANWSAIFTDPVNLAGPISGLGTSTVEFGTPIPGSTQSRLSYVGQQFPTPIRVRNHHANSGVQVGQLT